MSGRGVRNGRNGSGREPVSAHVEPQDLEAEQRTVGALLTAGADGPAFAEQIASGVVETGLKPADFYFESHGLIYDACADVAARGLPCDVTVVVAELERRGKLDDAGGRVRLHELAALAPAASNAAHYAQVVLEKAQRRLEVAAGIALTDAGRNGGLPQSEPLKQRLLALLETSNGASAPKLEPLWLAEALEREIPSQREYVEGVLQVGVVAEIAGVPYTGKSSVALELAHKVAAGRGELLGRFPIVSQARVAYFWGDDSEANELARVHAYGARHGYASEPLALYLNPPLVLPADLPRLAREISGENFGLVVLDSVYNFAPGVDPNNGAEVTALYGALKRLCDERETLTIVLVDHAPKPSESNKGRAAAILSIGSVFKAAQVRCSITLGADGDTTWVAATGNNVRGFKRTLAVYDEDAHELRLVDDAPARDYRAEALAFLTEHPGATQKQVSEGINCRREKAQAALEEAKADGEVYDEQVEREDVKGRLRPVQGWFLAEQRHNVPPAGTLWDAEPEAAVHEGSPTAAPPAPLGAGGRADGEAEQGLEGAGTT